MVKGQKLSLAEVWDPLNLPLDNFTGEINCTGKALIILL